MKWIEKVRAAAEKAEQGYPGAEVVGFRHREVDLTEPENRGTFFVSAGEELAGAFAMRHRASLLPED